MIAFGILAVAFFVCLNMNPLSVIAFIIQILSALAGLAWLILATVYVFKNENSGCNPNNFSLTTSYEVLWADEFNMNWRIVVAIWSIAVIVVGLSCIGGIMFVSCQEEFESDEITDNDMPIAIGVQLCGAIIPVTMLIFYSIHFNSLKSIPKDEQCCLSSSDNRVWDTFYTCTSDTTDYNYTENVTERWKTVSMYNIIVDSLWIGSGLFFTISFIRKNMCCVVTWGICQIIAVLGGFAWLITATVFVYNEASTECADRRNTHNSDMTRTWF